MGQRFSASVESKEFEYSRWQLVLKRLLDLLVVVVLLVILSPLWLIIVLWIRSDSSGPAIFKQTRVGLGGKPYTIYKFRTMVQNAEALMKDRLEKVKDLENFVFQEKDDPRITRSGRFLRKTSLDELPQLLNILVGNMSLVGPRPEVPELVKLYTPEQQQRLNVLPGVTGLAQVNGRSELTLGETMAYDLEYVRIWSFWLDLKILWKTIFVVFTGKGAY
ncbi:sugar transferase [Desulfosporosinus metallidurans]|uniref:Undecaprenyl-phosphate galactosephosphotransferase n=1 Tax=Desulfosporosinus metallidurans TaxID=1888891 RepID=A0A1Q8QWQ0_9FIRM|nr:sugar transferase [Desulfosporosinus metallidurans]OLN31774.1 Undecaprenyl-phosphate galactosephosphotransferase [Desulfosporosinus metallidurans]